ncbi:MAG: hypothetical protein IPJ31_06720 [Bacteroidetes bacterium]|nr:hypothetical protein [Bacteroidota bacterium]
MKPGQNTEALYQRAIENSMYATAKKVHSLIDIRKQNPNLIWKTIDNEDYLLVLTWKSKNFYPASGKYNTGQYETWVTIAPELYHKMHQVKPEKQELRLKQLLGLPPTAQNKIFIEFWVRPIDLFRPCPDKVIDDSICNTCFTAKDSIDVNYIQWFNTSRIDRYYANGLYNQYPWTQLGYTYDWHPKNKSHVGVSEFVIGKNKNIYVNKSYTTAEYLAAHH